MAGKLICPMCGSTASMVINSRPRGAQRARNATPGFYRRRQCEACGTRYSTIEVTAEYLDQLESFRRPGFIEELLKVQSALKIAIDRFTKVRGGTLL